jgi:hypothetical protein
MRLAQTALMTFCLLCMGGNSRRFYYTKSQQLAQNGGEMAQHQLSMN